MTTRRLVTPLLTVLLMATAGCHRKVHVAAAPPPPPVPMISVPPPTHPSEPATPIETELSSSLDVLLPRRPLPRFRPRPTTARQLALLLKPVPQPEPLGQLTTGGESAGSDSRNETQTLLRNQHLRLSSLSPTTVALHARQVDQVRLFLQQADDAWTKLDVEGARTLATKAKVLLDEIA